MKRKRVAAVLTLIIILAYTVRVYYVNSTAVAPIIQRYPMGADVAIEDDFFESSDEKMNGYTVTVLNTTLLTIDEFQEQYGKVDEYTYDILDYMLLVCVKFRNESNTLGESAGINLAQYILQEGAYITYLERDVYSYVNDFDSLAFALRFDTEKEFIIPFGINTEYINIDRIENGTPELVISLYPHKKSIKLNS